MNLTGSARRIPVVVGLGSGIGAFQGMFYYLGGRYDTFRHERDEFARKETIRRTTRLPIEQTISEIGEGRGKSRMDGFAIEQLLTRI